MLIRHADMRDLDAVTKLEADSFIPSEAATKEKYEYRLKNFSDCFWLLDDFGEIYSFVVCLATDKRDLTDDMFENISIHNPDGEWLMILSVATSPRQRHRGYAKQVMNQAIKDTKKLNRKGMVLTCKEKYISFYAQFGFVNEGKSVSEHGGAVWYQMRLTF